MKKSYTISKDKQTGLWYAHKVGFSYIPVISERGTFHKTKKGALHVCADCMGLPYKEYMKLKGGEVILGN